MSLPGVDVRLRRFRDLPPTVSMKLVRPALPAETLLAASWVINKRESVSNYFCRSSPVQQAGFLGWKVRWLALPGKYQEDVVLSDCEKMSSIPRELVE